MKPDNLCRISRSGLTGEGTIAPKTSPSPVLLWPSHSQRIREFLDLYKSQASQDDLAWAQSYLDELICVSERLCWRANLAAHLVDCRGVVL